MTTYYVQPNGTGTNCTQAQNPATPFNELLDILNTSNPCALTGGDVVEVRANIAGGMAIFDERFDCNASPGTQCIPGGTDWNNPVTIRGRDGDTITIRPSGIGRIFSFDLSTQHHIILDNLDIDGSLISGSHLGVWVEDQAEFIRVQDCHIHDTPMSGLGCSLHTSGGSEGMEILNCIIDHNGTDTQADHNIYIGCPNSIISGNSISYGASRGIQIFNQHPGFEVAGVANITITRNQIFANGSIGLTAGGSSTSLIANNLIYANGTEAPTREGQGIQLAYSGGYDGIVANNTIYNNAEECIWIDTTGGNPQIYNNICYQNDTLGGFAGEINDDGSTTDFFTNLCGEVGTGCAVVGDPLFSNAAGGDFLLLPGSPALDAGTMVAEVTDYFDGSARTATSNTIGAMPGPTGTWEAFYSLTSDPYAWIPLPNVNREPGAPRFGAQFDVEEENTVLTTNYGVRHIYRHFTRQVWRLTFRITHTQKIGAWKTMHDALDGELTPFYFRVGDDVLYCRKERGFAPTQLTERTSPEPIYDYDITLTEEFVASEF